MTTSHQPSSFYCRPYSSFRRHWLPYSTIRWLVICLVSVGLSATANAQKDRLDRLEDFFQENLFQRQSERRAGGSSNSSSQFRSIDGAGNNRRNLNLGKAGRLLIRVAPAGYVDSASSPPRMDMPSGREISNAIFDQREPIFNSRGLTDMVWQWGQFLDHDIDLTETHIPLEPLPIFVPSGDPWFDPNSTGQQMIVAFRSIYATNTGTTNNRQQINEITHWIDGSNVYGSEEETAHELRRFEDGLMKVSQNEFGDLLPEDEDGFFLAGDVRANEQTGLVSMHTLFVREHNRIARSLRRENRRMSDEEIYQNARRRVIATLQAITYNEFIPALMGENALAPYQGYDPGVTPEIANTFSTAAFRFGHSMLPNELLRLDNDGNVITDGNLALADAFFNPDQIRDHGIEPYLMGLMNQQAQEIDNHINDAVRNFLFGQPGSGGFDLVSLNIQRGRDHGLPNINWIRWSFGMPTMFSFAQLTDKFDVRLALNAMYGGINKADPWVLMLCEDHQAGSSLGSTAHGILKNQFERLRDGDRFWYRLEFTGRALNTIEGTRLSDVIRRNTNLRQVREDVFRMP